MKAFEVPVEVRIEHYKHVYHQVSCLLTSGSSAALALRSADRTVNSVTEMHACVESFFSSSPSPSYLPFPLLPPLPPPTSPSPSYLPFPLLPPLPPPTSPSPSYLPFPLLPPLPPPTSPSPSYLPFPLLPPLPPPTSPSPSYLPFPLLPPLPPPTSPSPSYLPFPLLPPLPPPTSPSPSYLLLPLPPLPFLFRWTTARSQESQNLDHDMVIQKTLILWSLRSWSFLRQMLWKVLFCDTLTITAFCSSHTPKGFCTGVVLRTGDRTMIGHIAQLSGTLNAESKTCEDISGMATCLFFLSLCRNTVSFWDQSFRYFHNNFCSNDWSDLFYTGCSNRV